MRASARRRSHAQPAATVTAASGSCAQVAPPRLPSSHIIADRAASPRAAPNTMTVVTAPKPYASAVPVRISRSGVRPRGERATAYTSAMAASAETNADTDSAHTPSPASAPSRMTALAPTAAPEEMPRTKGVGQRVAHHGLHGHADGREPRAGDGAEQDPGQPDLPDDGVRGRVVRGHGPAGEPGPQEAQRLAPADAGGPESDTAPGATAPAALPAGG